MRRVGMTTSCPAYPTHKRPLSERYRRGGSPETQRRVPTSVTSVHKPTLDAVRRELLAGGRQGTHAQAA